MISKMISISVGILSLATSAALATGLTERMQSDRMTVVQWTAAGDNSSARSSAGGHRWPRRT